MEGTSHRQSDHEQEPEGYIAKPSADFKAIHLGVLAAEANGREIDDGTARRIASQLHGGQASALYGLASSGNIDEERVYREIGACFDEQQDPQVREWINWLGTYCVRRADKGPVAGWHRATDDEKTQELSLAKVPPEAADTSDQPWPASPAAMGEIALASEELRSPNRRERASTISVVVMPADEDQPIARRDIDRGYKAGQRIVGGLIQPVDMPTVRATIWVNEEGLLLRLPLNRRATELLWTNQPEHIGFTILVGDAYLTGLPDRRGETTNVPDQFANTIVET